MKKTAEIYVTLKFKNENGETEFIRREATVTNKHEAKEVAQAAWKTFKSRSQLDTKESLQLAEEESDYYTLNENGIPVWL